MTGQSHAGCNQCLVFRAPSTSSSCFNKAYVQKSKSILHAHNTPCSPAGNPSQTVTETVAMRTRNSQGKHSSLYRAEMLKCLRGCHALNPSKGVRGTSERERKKMLIFWGTGSPVMPHFASLLMRARTI